MKQIRNIILAAASIAALFACNKEIEVPEEIKQDVNYVTVSFNAETAPITKVSLTPDADDKQFSPAWVANDGMVVEYIYDDGEDIGDGTATATFNGTKFDMTLPDKTGEWEYTAYYPSKTAIPFGAARTQAGDAFNGAYDIMNGSLSVTSGAPGKDGNGNDIVIPMDRFTAIQYFHFTSDIDEPLVSATLTVDGTDPIAAETVAFSGSSPVVLAPETGSATSKSITLTFSGTTNAQDFKLWFSVLPGSYNSMSLTIETTNYTKTITRNTGSSETYVAGKLYKVSGVKLNNWSPKATYYRKVTSTEGLMNGTYLIVYEGNSTHDAAAFDGSRGTLDGSENGIAVTIADNKIESTTAIDAASFTISIDNGTILSASGHYVGDNSYGNNLHQSEDADTYNNSFSIDGDGNAVISLSFSGGDVTLRYNYASDQLRFRYYKSGQQPIALYLKDGTGTAPTADTRTAVTLSFDPNNPAAITLGDDFTVPTLVKDPVDAPVSYSVETSPAGIATINASTGVLTITAAGSITVTAAVSDETNYKPASASYTLTVNAVVVPTGYESTETSNVTLSTTGGTSASDATVDGEDAIKVGTGSAGGAVVINVPSGTTKLHLHAAAWNGVSNLALDITGATVSPSSIDLTPDAGISGNSPFTLSGDPADFYFVLELSDISSETPITFTSSIAKRFVIWGVNTESGPDNREDAGMSWSAASASATWSSTGISFTVPTLTEGHASGITYESTNTSVATINDSGVVSIVGGGETTIKAKFNGDATYKPATVSYILTVTDNRPTVETPTFSPAAGTVAANTTVTISCATNGATIHYTVDGSTPTEESPVYSSAITIDVTKTIKALAVMENYKNSSIATASYVVGVVNTSTESNPYNVGDARDVADQLGSGSLDDVYVMGIITAITTAYNSTYGNVSFDITADGDSGSNTFRIYRAPASSESDFVVGDAVEFKGILKKYNSTYELDGSAGTLTLIAQVHKPTISPNGGSFTSSETVSISAESGATIKYSIDGSAPATNYSAALTLTETTTIKAVAVKGILTSGVASATFTKSNGGGNTGGTLTIDFENAASSYSDWTFSNVQTQKTNANVSAHGGSYFGNTTNSSGNGVSSDCYITTTNKISSPSSITFYISKQSTNTTASTWVVKVSSDGSSWTQVGDSQNAGNGVTRGTWYEVTRNLSSYSNVYVRIEYSGSTAIRNIDDVSLSYN